VYRNGSGVESKQIAVATKFTLRTERRVRGRAAIGTLQVGWHGSKNYTVLLPSAL
jgi:hypothetical protein